jgi:hypothetical protein
MKLHLIHDWSKWSAPFDTAHGCIKLQTRTCTVCGKNHTAKIVQPWNEWFVAATIIERLKGVANEH